MITRRQGREWAVQALVQFDLNPPTDVDAALVAFWDQLAGLERDALADDEVGARLALNVTDPKACESLAAMRAFAEARIRGVWRDHAALDAALEPYLEHWSVYRLGTVERAALRLGVWELENCAAEIPAPIVVNEAVDLVKFFSETKSGRFVNGVLDRFAKERIKKLGTGEWHVDAP